MRAFIRFLDSLHLGLPSKGVNPVAFIVPAALATDGGRQVADPNIERYLTQQTKVTFGGSGVIVCADEPSVSIDSAFLAENGIFKL